jgi:hypothetical protein
MDILGLILVERRGFGVVYFFDHFERFSLPVFCSLPDCRPKTPLLGAYGFAQ